MKYVRKLHMAKTYKKERDGLECPRGYSNEPKLKNEPQINNGASAACSVFVIISRLSASSLNSCCTRHKRVLTLYKNFKNNFCKFSLETL